MSERRDALRILYLVFLGGNDMRTPQRTGPRASLSRFRAISPTSESRYVSRIRSTVAFSYLERSLSLGLCASPTILVSSFGSKFFAFQNAGISVMKPALELSTTIAAASLAPTFSACSTPVVQLPRVSSFAVFLQVEVDVFL